jgi:hypothetical protein
MSTPLDRHNEPDESREHLDGQPLRRRRRTTIGPALGQCRGPQHPAFADVEAGPTSAAPLKQNRQALPA